LHAAYEYFQNDRQASIESLSKEKTVIVYSFGSKGREFAYKLREAGIDCLVYDNAKGAVESAAAEGFKTTSDLTLDLPLIVAAGQEQLSILAGLTRPAYSLPEGFYSFDLICGYGKARLFTEAVLRLANELYRIYKKIDESCRKDFLNVLLFRASLDVRHIASTRKPVSQMWIPPAEVTNIRSYCDVGAYDGDTLISMKAAFPSLESTLAVEPNSALVSKIQVAASNSGLKNRVFNGAAWSHKTKLNCRAWPNGMMVITEDAMGTIDADALDNITSSSHYDYVKFDVEGAEAPALTGAQSLLRGSRCIAIASYHLPNDFVDIPNQVSAILGTDSEWRCAFHHYSEVVDDSIFYFFRGEP
jgi:FkbM family methyltransferase